jgi:hypothetical protein
MMNQTMLGAGVGPYFTPVKCIAYNRTAGAVAIGDVLMLDHLGSITTFGDKSIQPNSDIGGDPAYPTKCWPLGNAILPATTGIGVLTDDPGSIFGVVSNLMQGNGAVNTKVELTLFGFVATSCSGANFGADLYPSNGSAQLTNAQVDGVRCLAKSYAPDGASGAIYCLFNGLLSPGGQTFLT